MIKWIYMIRGDYMLTVGYQGIQGSNSEEAARKIAEERQKFMEQYLDKFFKEWEGKD